MCWAQKCCYVIPANIGCVLMGICSFVYCSPHTRKECICHLFSLECRFLLYYWGIPLGAAAVLPIYLSFVTRQFLIWRLFKMLYPLELVSLFMLSGCIAYFIIEDEGNRQLATSHDQYVKTLGLQLSMTSVRILMAIAIIVAVLGMMFSAMLVVGITKNKPSFVLCYFAFGIIITIVGQLSALLVLLENCWILALVLFIVSLIHIHFMVVVHTVYELMLRGKDFRFHQQADDVDPLADCFDEDIERI